MAFKGEMGRSELSLSELNSLDNIPEAARPFEQINWRQLL